MKTAKRITAAVLAIAMAASFTACGGGEEKIEYDYDTLGITPEVFAERHAENVDLIYTTEYTSTDKGDGTSTFVMSCEYLGGEFYTGTEISGTMENSTGEIMEINCIYPVSLDTMLEWDDSAKLSVLLIKVPMQLMISEVYDIGLDIAGDKCDEIVIDNDSKMITYNGYTIRIRENSDSKFVCTISA